MVDVVVIGAGYAGLTCALRLSSRVRQFGLHVRIQLVSPHSFVVERIRLHQLAAGQQLVERPIEDQLAGSNVRLVIGTAEAIDLDGQTVRVGGQDIRWDRLVLAGGSRTDLHRVQGAAEHAIPVEPESAHKVRQALSMLPEGARVAVVGGGLAGIEIASEITETYRHLDVHLISGNRLAQEFSSLARAHVLHTLSQRLAVKLYEDQRVLAVGERHVQTASTRIPFELCIWATGFVASPLGKNAGLEVNAAGQVLVDPMLRSISHPQVYVAGDMGAPVVPPGQRLPMGCKSAMPMGAHVAENIVRERRGQELEKFDYALLFYCVSLGRRDGLIQWADEQGRLTGRILTGRRAALFKELICRSTIWAMRLERKGIRGVVWKHTGNVHNPVNDNELEHLTNER